MTEDVTYHFWQQIMRWHYYAFISIYRYSLAYPDIQKIFKQSFLSHSIKNVTLPQGLPITKYMISKVSQKVHPYTYIFIRILKIFVFKVFLPFISLSASIDNTDFEHF